MAEENKTITVGQVVNGVVDGITNFGAFVKLPDGRKGLVHISEVANAYVERVEDFVKNGDEVKVLVLSEDGDKLKLSIKRANGDTQAPRGGRDDRGAHGDRRKSFDRRDRRDRRDDRRRGPMSFEDKLARFMKESGEKLADLHNNIDAKRGGSGFSRRRASR